jgi:hypothetical protein
MLNFETYMKRHGELWIQDIIEQVEKKDGVRPAAWMTLEHRWDAVMNGAPHQTFAVAA